MTIKKVIFGLIASILVSANAIAQTIAVVDVQLIASKIPQTATMQQTLMQEFNGPNEEVKKLQSDIKFNIEKFQRESMTMSDDQKKELQTKIEGLQQTYQAKAQPLQQQMRQRQAEEQNKILSLIQQSISSVAADEKIDIVLEARSIVFLAEGQKDISEMVVKKLSK